MCSHGGHPELKGKDEHGQWRTGPTGAYLPEICSHMAVKAFADFRARAAVQVTASAPADGGECRAGPLILDIIGPKFRILDWIKGSPQLPPSKRDYVQGASVTLGLSYPQGEVVINSGKGLPVDIVPTINTLITDTLRKEGFHLMWTSIQLNLNTVSDWHQDWGNVGPSAIGALGQYHGGDFQIQGFPQMNINDKVVIFNGQLRHRSLPFKGTRLSFVAFRHPGIFGCDDKLKGRLKALGFIVDDPACLLPPTRVKFSPKKLWDPSYLYIGRGSQQDDVEKSIWANPFPIKAAGSRDRALEQYEAYLENNADLKKKLPELEGRKLMCHCGLGERCHGDILIEEFKKYVDKFANEVAPPPPGDDAVYAEAARRKEESGRRTPKNMEGRAEPSVVEGVGPPLFVYKGATRRVLSEGGGLCSPGLWPPDRRFEPEGGLLRIRSCIVAELNELATRRGGLSRVLSELVSGSLSEPPFPSEATDRIRKAMREDTPEVRVPEGAQEQTIDIELLHRLLVLAGDVDAEAMEIYQDTIPCEM